jgi:predicted amidohydrolase
MYDLLLKGGEVIDPAHGRYNFSFNIARHAIDQGLLPDVISTDLCVIAFPVVQSLPFITATAWAPIRFL